VLHLQPPDHDDRSNTTAGTFKGHRVYPKLLGLWFPALHASIETRLISRTWTIRQSCKRLLYRVLVALPSSNQQETEEDWAALWSSSNLTITNYKIIVMASTSSSTISARRYMESD
jgi:hypothetical protein